jgi:hypothetical protein
MYGIVYIVGGKMLGDFMKLRSGWTGFNTVSIEG